MRLEWLDVLKGIGIVSVVLGHVLEWRYVYSFHMPLFIFPYFSFMLLLNMLTYSLYGNHLGVYRIVYGGETLIECYGTFWFVTVLFLSLIILNLVIKWHINVFLIIMICLSLSYIFQFSHFKIAWNAHVVPMALLYMLLGYIYRRTDVEQMINRGKNKLYLYCLILFVSIVPLFTTRLNLDMKIADYGLPFFSLISSVLISYGVMLISKLIVAYKIKVVLVYIGKASLVIMFLHQFFRETLPDLGIEKRPMRLILAIAIPTLIYFLFEKNRITRTCFLGK